MLSESLVPIIFFLEIQTRQKGLHKQLLSDVVDVLACVYLLLLASRAEREEKKSYSAFC